MSTSSVAHSLTIWLWGAIAASLLAWISAGYSWPFCVLAVLPLLAPLNGLLRGRRYTYAWATLFAVPYLAFAVTELLANPQARALLQQPKPGGNSAWEEFRKDERLLRANGVNKEELEMLSQVALMGEVRSVRDFVHILQTVRHSLSR